LIFFKKTFNCISLLKIIVLIIPLLISVAYFTIAERKIMGSIQRRRGPNIIGFLGLLQPLADGLKLFVKETTLPSSSNTLTFLFAPSLAFVLSLISWSVIPLSKGVVVSDLALGSVYLFAVSSLNVYSILLAGWSSNSKYAFLGAVRSTSQMISYEIFIGLALLTVVLSSKSFNLNIIVLLQEKVLFAIFLLPVFFIFYTSILAETNRHPFDLPEAEAELVSGYNVEYSAMTFALFFLGEYANMLLMSIFSATLFLGGWLPLWNTVNFFSSILWTCLKIILGVIFFIITRATLPRFRYDQLMYLGWKFFFPISLGFFIFMLSLYLLVNGLP
jgi:NADH-quinone oxidoreductase subunit H